MAPGLGSDPLLRVEGLEVGFPTPAGVVSAVRGLGFAVAPGEAVALVGESGCGKSATALALLGLLPPPGRRAAGRVWLAGRELTALAPADLRAVGGRDLGMVFQDPMTSLNPVFPVGFHLAEALRPLGLGSRAAVRQRSLELLAEVGISAPEARLRAYPGELSGGLRQRVMIACAVACRPRLLVADEPTTALDVTVQAQIMALLGRLRREREMALLLISHDLGVVAQNVERVIVMYAGLAVEEAPSAALFAEPRHPYTQGLLASVPGAPGTRRGERLRAIPGAVPHPLRLPGGCPFRDRCPRAAPQCAEALPALVEWGPGHRGRCCRVDARV